MADVLIVLTVFFAIIIVFLICRIFLVLKRIENARFRSCKGLYPGKNQIKTMIIAGSGGHTAEILSLVSGLQNRPDASSSRTETDKEKDRYCPREYIVANTDRMSEDKIKAAEENMEFTSEFFITKVPRSREVHQSWLSTVLTTLYASVYCFPIVFKSRPDLLLCNGPGTCIPLCVAAFILKLVGIKDVSVIYVESICRVESLSLSARILYYIADHLLVQWQQLQKKYPRTEYIGRIV